ncbi:MAG: hypothetical protein K6W08_12035, partial [Firmicutes bacterium]|nr:hypothetical protein [Bacillota bacterium]
MDVYESSGASDGLDALARQAAEAVDGEAVVTLTRELVRIPSVYRPDDPSGTEAACAAYLLEFFRGMGLQTSTHDAAPNRPN